MSAKRRSSPGLPRCVLDSGALSSLLGRARDARLRLRFLTDYGGDVQIPAAILVECTTGDGGRDAEVNRVLGELIEIASGLTVIDESCARRAGELRYRSKSDDGIDALVAAVAVGNGSPAVILTSDPRDLERLLSRHPNVEVRAV